MRVSKKGRPARCVSALAVHTNPRMVSVLWSQKLRGSGLNRKKPFAKQNERWSSDPSAEFCRWRRPGEGLCALTSPTSLGPDWCPLLPLALHQVWQALFWELGLPVSQFEGQGLSVYNPGVSVQTGGEVGRPS